VKTKAVHSSAVDPLINVRRHGSQNRLTPSESALLSALVKYGGVTKAATALGLSPRSTASRMATIRDKIGATSSADAMRIWQEGNVA